MNEIEGRPRLLLVGAGSVGTAVATLLSRAGWHAAGVVSRTRASAEAAAARLSSRVITSIDRAPEADLYLLGVPEPAIEEVAASLVPAARPGALAVHLAGVVGIDPLGSLRDHGLGVAALHPVQTCPDVDTAIERLPGSAWGVTCSPGAEGPCEELIASIGGTPVRIEESVRPQWHSASVMTSNGISAVVAFGASILEAIGVVDPDSVLGPIAAATVANARAGGGGGATLTGPVVRGEADTLRRHLEALEASAPDLVPGYRLVVQTILEAATRAGRVSPETVGQIEAVIGR
jgi:predicted short-subunit dehydrogenase-like oxidoreductase (DUF2520 family)